MSRGDKSAYTDKQKRQAKHILESELASGRSKKDAERIAWATVNKQDGGGKKRLAKSASKAKAVLKDKPKSSAKSKPKAKAKLKSAAPKKKAAAKSARKQKSTAKSKK